MGRALTGPALLVAMLTITATAAGATAAEPVFRPPGPRDRCPVCGMFVAPFPSWVAEIVRADGSYDVFDGVKDLVRHLATGGSTAAAAAGGRVFVTDYYSLEPVDALTAWYVSGSDVLGPMGPEFIPFGEEGAAREFLRDHRGTGLHRFAELPAATAATP